MYLPDEPAEITITIESAEAFTGTLRVSLSHLDYQIEAETISVSLQPDETLLQTVTFTPPSEPKRGYGVDVALIDGNGVVATGSGAFDVLERWSQAPRYGFLSSFGPEMDADTIAEAASSLRR